MKKLFKRVFGIAASAMIFATSAMPTAFAADGHSHHAGENTLKVDSPTEKGYTITLQTPDNYKEGVTPEFGAYQIFTGTVKNGVTSYTNPGDTLEQIPLTDIKWGNAFGDFDTGEDAKKKIVEFVYALATTPTEAEADYKAAFANFHGFDGLNKDGSAGYKYASFADKDTENQLDERFYEGSGRNVTDVKFDKLATEVADVIEDNNNLEWLQAFTDILGGYGKNYSKPIGIHPGYVTQCYDSAGTWNKDAQTYTMTVPEGYYMILDITDLEDVDESYSARMLFVANNITQQIKQDVPSLTKTIAQDNGDVYGSKTEAAGVGDEVKFRLTGELPSNYDQYTLGYQFTFTDTLSKCLTLKGTKDHNFDETSSLDYDELTSSTGFVVEAIGAYKSDGSWEKDKKITIDVDSYKSGTHTQHSTTTYAYNATVTKDKSTGKQTLIVDFPCLKEIQVTEAGSETYTLGYDTEKGEGSVIYIYYTAVVDEDAVVSPKGEAGESNGNTNTAVLTYSDNPQNYADTDNTTEEKATVYTFGMDIIKVDAAQFLREDGNVTKDNENKVGLADAQFVILRRTGKSTGDYQWQIAKFQSVESDPDSTEKIPDSFKKNGYNTIYTWVDIDDSNGKENFDKSWIFTDTKLEGEHEYLNNIYTIKDVYKSTSREPNNAETTKDYYNITSTSNGSLNVSGLNDEVTYTIVETYAPEKYAMIAPFTVKISAAKVDGSGEEYSGTVANNPDVTNTTGGKSFTFENFVELLEPNATKSDKDGTLNMYIANFKFIDLPSTGGVGTYLFYILGAGGLAISFLLFKMSRKKAVN